jgi:amino acid transporter
MVTLSIGSLDAALAADNPFIFVLRSALGPVTGNLLVGIAMTAMWFCGLSSVTSNSRMLYAFARDGGLPFSRQLAKVSPRFKSPAVAIWVSAAMALLIALGANVYSAMVALSTLALYASYLVPIVCGFLKRKERRRGPWSLGSWSAAANIVAIIWIAVCIVLFVLPPDELAGYAFAGCLVALTLYWFFWMRSRFKGPPVSPLLSVDE